MMNENKRMFPLFVDLRQKKILIVGGGKIAARRAETLTAFADHITVVSPAISRQMEQMIEENNYRWMKDSYHCEQLKDIDLALACTSDEQVNRQIAEDCRKRGILVNAASDKNLCDFQFPGILLEEEVTIAFNSSGKDHQKVKQLRQEVAVCLKCRDKKKGGAV